jgi:hypothetical protein
MVDTLTLRDYVARKSIGSIAFLKVDTEGSEFAVLNGLREVPDAVKPEYVIFEYGGGGTKGAATGGWAEKFWTGTKNCARLLSEQGYRSAVVLETALPKPVVIADPTVEKIEAQLPADASVGNMLFAREAMTPERFAEVTAGLESALAKAKVKTQMGEMAYVAKMRLKRIVNGVKRRL